MFDKLKKSLDFFPIILPIVYVLGFIVTNGYLSNYGFSDYNILNFTYLRSGIIFSFFFISVFLLVIICYQKENMTDNLEKSWSSILLALSNTMGFTFVISLYLIDTNSLLVHHRIQYIIFDFSLFSFALFRILTANKVISNNRMVVLISIPSIILPLIGIIILCFNFELTIYLLVLNVTLSILFTFIIADYGDKNFYVRLSFYVICIVGLTVFFGKNIYAKIPSKYGGGEQYQIIVFNVISINDIVNEDRLTDTLSVLYENDKNLLVKDLKSNIIFVDRSEIKAFKILKK